MDYQKMRQELKETKDEVYRKSEYLGINIICPKHEYELIELERLGKLTTQKIVDTYNNFECIGCDECNIPDFL